MSFETVYRLRRWFESLSGEHEGHSLHCIPSAYDPRDYKYLNFTGVMKDIQAEGIDYRSNLPPVFDQGQRGSCVACASTWTIKAYEEIKEGDYPGEGFSPAFVYTLCKQNDGAPEQEGTQPRVAMKVMQKIGVCPEDIMPYSTLATLPVPEVPPVPDSALGAATGFRIQSYAQLCAAGDSDRSQLLTAIRQALKGEGPFLMALLVCENFAPDENNLLPLPAGQVRGGHAIGIVGDLPQQECLILRNSWGSSWGDNGYAYLPYAWLTGKGDMGWYVFEAWTASDKVVPQPATRIVVAPGASYMMVDGKRVPLNHPAIISRTSHLLLPIKVFAENMGYQVVDDGHRYVLTRLD